MSYQQPRAHDPTKLQYVNQLVGLRHVKFSLMAMVWYGMVWPWPWPWHLVFLKLYCCTFPDTAVCYSSLFIPFAMRSYFPGIISSESKRNRAPCTQSLALHCSVRSHSSACSKLSRSLANSLAPEFMEKLIMTEYVLIASISDSSFLECSKAKRGYHR